jgi:putative nucleic acid binding protein
MLKKILIIGGLLIIIAFGIGLYMFNMPHRDVLTTPADMNIQATELVKEFLENNALANEKYLSDDGDSKILVVSGRIASITEDGLGQKVVLLKEKEEKMGVNCTFTLKTNNQTEELKIYQIVKIKGVIRAGAEYDEDLDLNEDVIMEKCSIVS